MLTLTFRGFFAGNSAASTSGSISSCLIAHSSFEPNNKIKLRKFVYLLLFTQQQQKLYTQIFTHLRTLKMHDTTYCCSI